MARAAKVKRKTTLTAKGKGKRTRITEQAKIGGGGLSQAARAIQKRRKALQEIMGN